MRRILLPLGALAALLLVARTLPVAGAFSGRTETRSAHRAALAPAPSPPLAGQERELAMLFPADSVLFVEAPGLDELLAEGTDGDFVSALLTSPLGSALSEAGISPDAWLSWLESRWGRDPLATLSALTDQGVALALRPRAHGQPAMTLVLRTENAGLLSEVLDDAFGRIEAKYRIPGAFDEPADRVLGADVWVLGDELVVARRGGLLIVGNDRDFARRSLELATTDTPDEGVLASNEAFRELAAKRPEGVLAWAWVDLPALVDAGAKDLAELTELAGVPGAQALLGPALSGIPTGPGLALWLAVDGRRLEISIEGVGAKLPEPLLARAEDYSPPPAIADPSDLAYGLLYRDYASFVNDRAKLFAPELLPSFSEPLSTLSLFFGGADFGEDVLPGLSPWILLVSRDLEFEPGVVPENPLPGLCAIAELEQPERLGPEVITAFQTLIGILNADRAQNRGGMMRLRLGLEGDVELTSASFLPPGPEDGVDMRYNLEPACAMVGPYLVLGTHADLVRDVIRRLDARRGTTGHAEGADEFLTISGAALLRTVEANFETLVMNKVLDEGVTPEEAEGDLNGLRLLLESVESARFETHAGLPAEGRPVARLILTLAEGGDAR